MHCQVDSLSELFSELKDLNKDHEGTSQKKQKVSPIIFDDAIFLIVIFYHMD